MDTETIIAALEAERDRLDHAIAALRGGGARAVRYAKVAGNGRRGKRRFSPATRRKLAELARKRWAKRKAAGKNSL